MILSPVYQSRRKPHDVLAYSWASRLRYSLFVGITAIIANMMWSSHQQAVTHPALETLIPAIGTRFISQTCTIHVVRVGKSAHFVKRVDYQYISSINVMTRETTEVPLTKPSRIQSKTDRSQQQRWAQVTGCLIAAPYF